MKRADIKYDLSIGMIVKNEEKYLERCLQALLPLKEEISCEIIVTDTGSTDKTVEIAEKYADKVLNFEWCDDFSAARNTGVEASSGAWFMFVDADEIFDESVIEIAKFIKSKNCNKYDSATYIVRNYTDNRLENYSDFVAKRLCNFNKQKRYFYGIIHECIETNQNSFSINAVAHHYGYISRLNNIKGKRNQKLLEKQLNNNPNDIRVYKHLMDCLPFKELIKIANKAMNVVDNSKENNYKNLQSPYYIFVIYCQLAYVYSETQSYDLVIETCERYLEHELVINFKPMNILPTLEITYMYAYALFETNRFQYALDTISKYQKKYLHLKDVGDNIFVATYSYKYNNNFEYTQSLILALDCYHKLNDNEAMVKALEKFEAYKTNDVKIRNYVLNRYVKYIVKYDKLDLFDKVVSYFTSNNEDIYNNSEFIIFFYANFMLNGNIDCYLQNCSYSAVLNYIVLVFNVEDSEILENLYVLITNNANFSNLKEMLIYIKLMELYLINQSNIIMNKSVNTNTINFNHIFELYIKNLYLYAQTVYNNEIFISKQFSLLEESIVFVHLVYPALEQKNSEGNLVEYIKALKEGLIYLPKFKSIVSIVVDVIKRETDNINENTIKPNNEFSLLSEKIKLTIIDAIKTNDIKKAELIIEEYKKINPTDPDIVNLSNLIKN